MNKCDNCIYQNPFTLRCMHYNEVNQKEAERICDDEFIPILTHDSQNATMRTGGTRTH